MVTGRKKEGLVRSPMLGNLQVRRILRAHRSVSTPAPQLRGTSQVSNWSECVDSSEKCRAGACDIILEQFARFLDTSGHWSYHKCGMSAFSKTPGVSGLGGLLHLSCSAPQKLAHHHKLSSSLSWNISAFD